MERAVIRWTAPCAQRRRSVLENRQVAGARGCPAHQTKTPRWSLLCRFQTKPHQKPAEPWAAISGSNERSTAARPAGEPRGMVKNAGCCAPSPRPCIPGDAASSSASRFVFMTGMLDPVGTAPAITGALRPNRQQKIPRCLWRTAGRCRWRAPGFWARGTGSLPRCPKGVAAPVVALTSPSTARPPPARESSMGGAARGLVHGGGGD